MKSGRWSAAAAAGTTVAVGAVAAEAAASVVAGAAAEAADAKPLLFLWQIAFAGGPCARRRGSASTA
eukprot:14277276-Heterocapsa_arctica.AAC.1